MGPYTRVAIVTGAASGIGAEISRGIAGPGTALLLHTRKNENGLAAVAEACRASGCVVETAIGDLADPNVPTEIVRQAQSRLGRVDQLISNAGQAARSTFTDLRAEDLQAAFDSMPSAFLRMAKAILEDVSASHCGRIVVISSFVAHRFSAADMRFPATSAAKAALEALAKALAVELAPTGSTVNIIVPGFTRKQGGGHLAATSEALKKAAVITPTGRLTEPTDIAAMARFLLSEQSAQITGQTIHVDGGLLLP